MPETAKLTTDGCYVVWTEYQMYNARYIVAKRIISGSKFGIDEFVDSSCIHHHFYYFAYTLTDTFAFN